MRKVELTWLRGADPATAELLELRRDVLRRPLGIDFTEEQLAREKYLRHLRARVDGVLAGALMLEDEGWGKALIRQVAVAEAARGAGVGRLMMLEAEEEARRQGQRTVSLHARDSAFAFYARLGYEFVGEPYVGFGVPHRDMGKELDIREARAEDVPAMKEILFGDGAVEWNWLPRPAVDEHLDGVAAGKTGGLVALGREGVVGFVTFRPDGFLTECAVRRSAAGKGYGTRLLKTAARILFARGAKEVTADRHEDNAASAAMMRKAGFEVVKVYDDPERRPTGTRRTALCALKRTS